MGESKGENLGGKRVKVGEKEEGKVEKAKEEPKKRTVKKSTPRRKVKKAPSPESEGSDFFFEDDEPKEKEQKSGGKLGKIGGKEGESGEKKQPTKRRQSELKTPLSFAERHVFVLFNSVFHFFLDFSTGKKPGGSPPVANEEVPAVKEEKPDLDHPVEAESTEKGEKGRKRKEEREADPPEAQEVEEEGEELGEKEEDFPKVGS